MLSVLYACLICINFNKYLHSLIKQIFDRSPSHILYNFVKCGAVNLCICIYIYIYIDVVIVIGVLGLGYSRLALNIYYCKYPVVSIINK